MEWEHPCSRFLPRICPYPVTYLSRRHKPLADWGVPRFEPKFISATTQKPGIYLRASWMISAKSKALFNTGFKATKGRELALGPVSRPKSWWGVGWGLVLVPTARGYRNCSLAQSEPERHKATPNIALVPAMGKCMRKDALPSSCSIWGLGRDRLAPKLLGQAVLAFWWMLPGNQRVEVYIPACRDER